ncbi:hypothetical protein M8R20_04870 [Pseudomonas sp. R2.Fl]|nr:hypothetical protein [Pseudomonas sp. R2.Fl]
MTQTDNTLQSDTILVVEDNILLALDAAASVTAAGYDVVMTARCGEALALLDTRPICGAILDFNVQDGTVVDVVKRLSEADIPFRVVSGSAVNEIELAGVPAEAIRSKPIDYGHVVGDLIAARAA